MPAAQQVVSIARALSHHVRLLIMDEPSAILDDGEIETLFEVVRRLTAEGVGVIYITHRLDEIRRIGDRVTVLDRRADDRRGASRLDLDRRPGRADGGREDRAALPGPAQGRPGTSLLEARDIQKLPEVRGVSLKVHAGEVVGLGGLVGSGRTELLRLIYGVDTPEAGEVIVAGERPAARQAAEGDRRRPRPRARGPQVRGAAARVEPHQERQPRGPRPVRERPARRQRRAERGRRAARGPEHGPRRPRPRGPRALGREPAEGRPRALAPARVQGPAARRADTRRRHLDQGRALPRDHGPRRRPGSGCWWSRRSSTSWSGSAPASS